MDATAGSEQVDAGTEVEPERPRDVMRALAAAGMAVRVLELEALVNRQAASIESLEAQLASMGARLGGRWDPREADDYGLAEPVRHRRCRGR